MKLYQLACATVIAVAPVANALAQGTTGPAVGAANTKESSDIKAGAAGKSATSKTTPGATGRTVVPGSNSTVADDKSGTAEARTGSVGGGSK
jgi:hypothetical protein